MFRWLGLVLIAVFAGCASQEYRELPRNDSDMPPYTFALGEVVSVTMKNEQVHEFEITGISKNSVRGNDIEVSYTDIQSVRVRESGGAEKGSNFLNYIMAIEVLLVVAFTALLA
ncbi:MAG: hypothetical protein H6985_14970 [Pseudomonadales bacterium]|nr:hypothetical protein [Pseudomonadales bacterium]